jgi:hypothetical protein
MKFLVFFAIAYFSLEVAGAHAATEVACQAMFRNADHNSDGRVGGPELQPFIASLLASGMSEEAIEHLVFRSAEFKENCMRDRLTDTPSK